MMPFPSQEQQKVSGGRKGDQGGSQKSSLESSQSSVPIFLQYPLPYTQDAPTPLLVAQSPSKLQFGNPYSISDPKGQSYFKKSKNTFCRDFNFQQRRLMQMRKMKSSQITSCWDYPPWVHPPGTVMWFASNLRATPAALKATRSRRRSKTIMWGSQMEAASL